MNTEKPQYNTARDCLKIIAIIAMTADHMHGAHEIGQRGGFGRTAVREVPDS